MMAKVDTLGAPGQTAKRTDAPIAAAGASDPAGRIEDLDLEGFERAVLFPTYGLMVQGVTDREAAAALCRAINEWLAEYCRHDPFRLIGVATLPMVDVDDAIAEARRAIENDGFRGAFRRPEVIPGAPKVHDRAWDPLWAYLAEADVPLAIHPGLAGVVPYGFYKERFDDDFPTMHATHFPVEAMMSITSFIGFGILERHPTLRLALLESGAVWALPYVHRLDEHLEMFGLPGSRSRCDPPTTSAGSASLPSKRSSPASTHSFVSIPTTCCSRRTIRTPMAHFRARPRPCSTPTFSTIAPAGVCCETTRFAFTDWSDMTDSITAGDTVRRTDAALRCHLHVASHEDLPRPTHPRAGARPNPASGDDVVQFGQHPAVGVRGRDRPDDQARDQDAHGRGVLEDRRRAAQRPKDLIDSSGRSITGRAAVENIDRVPAIVVVCWNPERGIRMKNEYERNPDGTLA